MVTFDVTSKAPKPKWYQLRRRLSNVFLWLAKKTYPENPEVWAFMCKQIMDLAIYGQTVTRVSPSEWHEIEQDKP